jgi:AcrR family transcriptional regulator
MMVYNEKQIQIIEEAEKLFAENGFNGTSVREIAKNAEVNLAMISYYFGSKDKLLEAIFIYRGEATKTALEKIFHYTDLTSLQKIDQLIGHYVNRVIAHQAFYKILTREMVINHTPETEEIIIEIKKQNLEIVQRIISEGQKQGTFKNNIDVPLMISVLSGTANNLLSTQKYYKHLSGLQHLDENEFQKHLINQLTTHLKIIIKTILTNDL